MTTTKDRLATETRPTPYDSKLALLLDLSAMMAHEMEFDRLLKSVGQRIAIALQAERATLYWIDARHHELRSKVADLPELPEIRLALGRGLAGHVARTGDIINLEHAELDPRYWPEIDRVTGFHTRSMLAVPIQDLGGTVNGVVQVLNKHQGRFNRDDEAFLLTLARQISLALVPRNRVPSAVGSPHSESAPESIDAHLFSDPGLVMQPVLHAAQRAASTDATVLIRGATGVGKSLLAGFIHRNSQRKKQPFVTVDCTTLPSELVESELFGHERGAFTGADRRSLGKVEAADGGTLFLDEIGDLPLASQAKLLRFLQDRTFERVGGRVPMKVNIRILTATHCNLEELVQKGRFRRDLFYRLKVLEIEVPALHQRGPGAVQALAEHQLLTSRQRYHRPDLRFSPDAITAIAAHSWPGNVRELEHAIERAVVLASGNIIEAAHLGLCAKIVGPATSEPCHESLLENVSLPLGLSLEEVEFRYVAATLRACGGNQSRASLSLGVGRNTLRRKMREMSDEAAVNLDGALTSNFEDKFE